MQKHLFLFPLKLASMTAILSRCEITEMKKVSIVTPVYYNQDSLWQHVEGISTLRDRLRAELSMDLELIYVNDGSGDQSLTKLKDIKLKYEDWITIVSLTKNFGSVHAISAGLNYVTGDCFAIVSADLQDPPELVFDMVSEWIEGSQFVVCARKDRHDPLMTTLFAKVFNFLTRKLIISDYPKGGYDLFLFDKQYLMLIKEKGKNFNLQIFCSWLGVKPKIIYYHRQKREHGKSRWTFRKKIKLMVDSFIGFSTAPIRFISLLGIMTSCVSFFYGLVIFYNALIGHVVVPGYASIVCILSFLLGLVIFMLGVVGEYLARIYDEVNNKPAYVIQEVI